MRAFFDDLPLSAQTAYAQLFDATLAAEHARSVADLSGSFNVKTIRGRKYWYYQYYEPSGKLRQVYVGPDGESVQRLMQQRAQPSAAAALPSFARAALALGCRDIPVRQFRVIDRLADYGFFRAGGVLVGTHAFLAYGNMLGVRWRDQERTLDIDFAHAGKAVALALPSDIEVRTHDAIESLQMGFLPVTGLDAKSGATYLIPDEPEFRLDFLTPRHRGGDAPFVHPKLNVTLQPLRFMEYSLEDVEQAALFCHSGATLVNVPSPARFALHKLLVYGERSGSFRAKSAKDLAQAAHLLAYLGEHRPAELAQAQKDLLSRGRGWVGRFRQGRAAVLKRYPELEGLAALRAR
jgi:hypothetical protein